MEEYRSLKRSPYIKMKENPETPSNQTFPIKDYSKQLLKTTNKNLKHKMKNKFTKKLKIIITNNKIKCMKINNLKKTLFNKSVKIRKEMTQEN